MKAGDRIRVHTYTMGHRTGSADFTVEKFRWCLGIFESEVARTMNSFTPLCDLFELGPESEAKYLPNHGGYYTNPVQAWMDIPA